MRRRFRIQKKPLIFRFSLESFHLISFVSLFQFNKLRSQRYCIWCRKLLTLKSEYSKERKLNILIGKIQNRTKSSQRISQVTEKLKPYFLHTYSEKKPIGSSEIAPLRTQKKLSINFLIPRLSNLVSSASFHQIPADVSLSRSLKPTSSKTMDWFVWIRTAGM